VAFIGNPYDMELSHLTNDGARTFMENLPSYDGVNMYKFFSKTSPDIVNILKQMLIFEPKNRIDPENALELSLFDDVRNERLEDASNIDHKVDISIAENVTQNTASYRNIFLEELFPYLRNGGPISPHIIFEENLRRRLIMCEELKEEDEEEEEKKRDINSHGVMSRSSSRCSLSSNLSVISSDSSVQTEHLEKEDEEDLKLPLLSRSFTIGSQKLENLIIGPITRTVRSLTNSFISSDGGEQKRLKDPKLKKEAMDLNNNEDEEEEEIMVSGKLLVKKLDPLYHEIQVEKKKSYLDDEEEEEEKKNTTSQSENLLCDPVSNNNKLQPIEKRKSVSDTGLQQSSPNKTT